MVQIHDRVYLCIIACLWVTFSYASFKYELSICAIFKDEAPYLAEWIEFHRVVGVEHFYLCSHNSEDNYQEILQPYLDQGIVELKELDDPDDSLVNFTLHLQCGWYNECLTQAREESHWVAFIDIDEFLFPSFSSQTIPEMLESYQQFAGVAVNWQLFGTSGVAKIMPGELLIERLICCAPNDYNARIFYNGSSEPTYSNRLVKSIVQPLYVSHFINPHFAIYLPGYYQVATDGVPFEGPHTPFVQIDKLRINHYWSRDEDFFYQRKMKRQQSWWNADEQALLDMKDDLNQTIDTAILRFVPLLQK